MQDTYDLLVTIKLIGIFGLVMLTVIAGVLMSIAGKLGRQ